jgi:hypothetical protein
MKTRLLQSALSVLARAVVLTLLLGFPVKSRAFSYEFSGRITEIAEDPWGWINGWGSVGDRFWGTLSYEPSGGNSYQYEDRTVYVSDYMSYPASLRLTLRTATQYSDTYGHELVEVRNSSTLDSLTIAGEALAAPSLSLTLEDSTGTALSDNSLPESLDPADWPRAWVQLGGRGNLVGEITSFDRVDHVPEPSTCVLMLLPLGLHGIRHLRNRRQVL